MLGKENTKGSMVGAGVACWPRECVSAFQVLLKPMGRGEPGDSHPVINE
jgi:hypothetical protein